MPSNTTPLAPLSRSMVSVIYAFEIAVLAYFVYGSLTGSLAVPSKHGALHLSGPAAWLACLFPICFLGLVAVRFDPAVSLPVTRRKVLVAVLAMAGVLSLVVAAMLPPRL